MNKQNEIDMLKSSLLGKRIQIENLCDAIDEFELNFRHKFRELIEIDPEGELVWNFRYMMKMRMKKGNTIERIVKTVDPDVSPF